MTDPWHTSKFGVDFCSPKHEKRSRCPHHVYFSLYTHLEKQKVLVVQSACDSKGNGWEPSICWWQMCDLRLTIHQGWCIALPFLPSPKLIMVCVILVDSDGPPNGPSRIRLQVQNFDSSWHLWRDVLPSHKSRIFLDIYTTLSKRGKLVLRKSISFVVADKGLAQAQTGMWDLGTCSPRKHWEIWGTKFGLFSLKSARFWNHLHSRSSVIYFLGN